MEERQVVMKISDLTLEASVNTDKLNEELIWFKKKLEKALKEKDKEIKEKELNINFEFEVTFIHKSEEDAIIEALDKMKL
jgi:hypothetical protein